ncbi:hypothetical protein GURKE_04760 [Brevundimonas phage vB_BpoS-Gurke]|uniref:Uncharacterized protein n=1 Tax=Brevundimonas phage vB_BpoS-Gurke TaxID=2948599 RepID=A0A9E7N2D2_9CAUD|nr:hypothetical protein GURKE_04760 [Brevundimonas phage vB_BpoS-Gurke]
MADVHIRLFHGRDTADQEMNDFGYEGPTIGPFRYVHITYLCDVKFAMEREAFKAAFPDVFADWEARGVSNGMGFTVDGDDRRWIEWHLYAESGLIAYGGKFYGDMSIIAGDA